MRTLIVALILVALTLVTLIVTPLFFPSAISSNNVMVGDKVIVAP